MDPKEPTCFTCGLALTDPPRLNHLASGAVCPSCRDRLLEILPALLPGGAGGAAEIEGAGAVDAVEGELEAARPTPGPVPLPPPRRPRPSSS